MVENNISLSRIEDSVILNGSTAKTEETSTSYANYFFFTATSINYTASTMLFKYDEYTGWEPSACLVLCTNDPNGETYAIRITVPKFSSTTQDVENRLVYASGVIQTDSSMVNSSYNICVRTNGCPEEETFVLSYTTGSNDSERNISNTDINFTAKYIVEKNIGSFTSSEPEAKMINVVARCLWNVKDYDFDDYSFWQELYYTTEKYNDTCEPYSEYRPNSMVYKNDNVLNLGPGFFKMSGNTPVSLGEYSHIYDANTNTGMFVFNEPLEAIGYHTFFFGKHYDNVSDIPSAQNDDYIGYKDIFDYWYYFEGNKKLSVNGMLKCNQYDTSINQAEYTFAEAGEILQIKTGKYLKIIGNQAFKGLNSLESVDLEDSPLERIGMSAFDGCESLTSFDIPDTVTLIGEGAFKESGLESVRIPAELEFIEPETFMDCTYLASVDFSDCENLIKICDNAFSRCYSLGPLSFPESLTIIENSAFYGCSNITSIDFPSQNMEIIGTRAFMKCNNLSSLTVPKGVIGKEAFRDCGSLMEVTIESGVIRLEEMAFKDCTAISAITIGTGVTSIETECFSGCFSVSQITYNGTSAQWGGITLGQDWAKNVSTTQVWCEGDETYVDI